MSFSPRAAHADIFGMSGCPHGMDPSWCYVCLVDASGAEPRTAWGLIGTDESLKGRSGPMTEGQASYIRFLCSEFGDAFDGGLTEGEAQIVIDSFMREPMTPEQTRTLEWLGRRVGTTVGQVLTYGEARATIRRLVALHGLRSA